MYYFGFVNFERFVSVGLLNAYETQGLKTHYTSEVQ